MNEPNSSDDLPFLDDLPVTPTPEQKPERTPSPDAPGATQPAETAEPKPAAAPPRAESSRPTAPQAPAPPVSAPKPERQPARPMEPQRQVAPPLEPERKRAVIPPAILAKRMQRYSVYLIVVAFLLVGANYDALTLSGVLWFAAGLTAGFAILCAVAVVLLNAIAWNFDRLRDELRGGREVIDLRE